MYLKHEQFDSMWLKILFPASNEFINIHIHQLEDESQPSTFRIAEQY